MYGYTAASVSGWMPCVEVSDSIIKSGWDLVSNVIRWVEYNECLKIVYGDTDSIFIYSKGYTG